MVDSVSVHEINVDPARADDLLQRIGKQAEAEEFAREQKFTKGQAAMDAADSAPESWATFATQSVEFTSEKICPAWELTTDEKGMASQSVAEVLDHYFPGAVEGFDQWHPLSKLAGTLFFIAATRIDYKTWRLAPMRKKETNTDESDENRRPDDSDDGQEPLGKNNGHFKIGGE